jgi:hypothetical protein
MLSSQAKDRRLATLLCVVSSWAAVWAQAPAAPSIAALISELSGEATVRSTPAAARDRARRFDAVPVGARLELGAQSRGVLVLAGGRRFALGPNARATVADDRLTATSGPVTELASLPTLPRLTALDESRPAGPPGAVRLRGAVISGVRPSHAVVLNPPLTLRFDPVAGASRYAVEVENQAGRRIFAAETPKPEQAVPPGVLEPGASYYWVVRTLDKAGGEARGTGQFRTLSLDEVAQRDALRRSLASEGDAGGVALLAEIDRRLGLYQEALEGFRAALAGTPADPAIQRAIRWLEAAARPEGP